MKKDSSLIQTEEMRERNQLPSDLGGKEYVIQKTSLEQKLKSPPK